MRGRITHDTNPDRSARKDYWGVALDSRTPRELARFYAAVLEWELGADDEDWATLKAPDGVAYIGFHLNEQHVRPVWPTAPDQPQQQLHLDFEVEDLAAAVAHAIELGARQAEFQPQESVRVMLDPDGHPFCLYS
jgi:catechol 2,3-dioxygenase-like lactoylglutathione lyase family enzyme